MKKDLLKTVQLFILVLACSIIIPKSSFEQIVTYATGAAGGSGPQTQVAANINTVLTSTTLNRANCSAIGSPCTNGMSNSGGNFSGPFNFNASGYITFSVVPNAGFQLNITGINAGVRSSSTGPPNGAVYYSTDNGVTWVGPHTFSPTVNTSCQTSSNGTANWATSFVANNSTYGVIIRIYGWNATNAGCNFQLHTVQLLGTVTGCGTTTIPVVTATAPSACSPSSGVITITSPSGSGMTYSIDGVTYTNTTGIFSNLAAGAYNNITAKSACGAISPVASVTIPAATNATHLFQTGFTSVLTPQFMGGSNGGSNTARLPVFFNATVSGLCANTTFRYTVQGAVSSDFSGTNPGAGNSIFPTGTGTTFGYSTSPDVTSSTSSNYGTFTTNSSGSYTGWFGFVTTGNTRFSTAGNVVYPSIQVALSSGTIVATRALNVGITVLTFGSSTVATNNNGTGIWGSSFENAGDFVLLYDGTNNLLACTCVEGIGLTAAIMGETSGGGAMAPFYASTTNVIGKASAWGTIIPNSITTTTGVRKIEYRRYDGKITYAIADADGNWVGGNIAKTFPTAAPVVLGSSAVASTISFSTKTLEDSFTVYNGETYKNTTNLSYPTAVAAPLSTGVLTINPGAKLAIDTSATASTLTLTGTILSSLTGTLVGSANSNLSISGTGALGTLFFDETTPGTSNLINTFTLNRNTGGTATLGDNLVIGNSLIMNNASSALELNDNTLTINGTISNSTGPGTFTGTANSNLLIGGAASGSIGGNLYFTSGSNLLNNFTINRNSGAFATLGTDLQIYGACALTLGKLLINGDTLTLNGTYTSGASNAGSLTGSSASNLVIGASATSVPLTFTYDASKINNSLKSLTVNTNASLANSTTSSSLYVTGGTTASPGNLTVVGNAIFSTHDSLTLQSNANGTACVGQNTSSTGYVTGNVTIERYIQSHRAWRLLTAPISSVQTINASWQEGKSNTSTNGVGQFNPVPGYGTEITNTITTDPVATGFDKAVTNNPSILYLNAAGTNWVAPTDTKPTNVNSQQGFMLFVRGDRSVVVTPPTFNPSTTTTLRTKGVLNQGTKQVTISGTNFRVVGNPYASGINFYNVYTNNSGLSGNTYYLWDPLITTSQGVGAFVTITGTAVPGSYAYTSAISPFDMNGRIESGAAFVMNFTGTGTLSIPETAKSSTGSALVFRPADDAKQQSFRGDLYVINADGTTDLDDGTLTLYDNQYSDSVSWTEDAKKLGNIAENLSLEREGQLLAIEKRRPINVNDTIFLSIKNMKRQTYQFVFAAENISRPGLIARLEDHFLNTSTPINLIDTSKINFIVTADPASQGNNRFIIVFQSLSAGPLPVTFTSVKASQQNTNSVAVQWSVTSQLNIKEYIIERSVDGNTFTQSAIIKAAGANSSSIINYNWLDAKATIGNNYYRIVSIDNNGNINYSQIVKVNLEIGKPEISVYPNPAKNGIINLQFFNQPKGIYQFLLFNNIGQQIVNIKANHSGGNSIQHITAGKAIAKGNYKLEIIKEGENNHIKTIDILFE